jgi:PAS domain-containing protein
MDLESGGRVFSFLLAPVAHSGYVNLYGRDITDRKRAEAGLAADLAALTRMHALSGRLLEAGGLQPLLQEIMDTAVTIMGAARGILQLLEGDSLRIVAHHGHQQRFLEFFASAENRASVCGEALQRGQRVVVPDIEESSLFAGTPSLAVLREAGVRAVQSTPMVSRAGTLLGILTTHWGIPHSPDEHDLWRIDLLARQAADLVGHAEAEASLRRSEEWYRTLFNTLIEGFCIIEVVFDAEGKPVDYRFLEVNPAFERQTGLHDAQGKLMRDLAPDHEEH